MKLLIGIMYSIENEFPQCIESIRNQTFTGYDYFVIEKLHNIEAHHKLYKTFMDNHDKYDFFIKLDADMVLARNTFFEEIIRYFSNLPNTDDLQIAVHDYFTNRLIYGLHVYSNRVNWKLDDERIFVDWPEKQNEYIQVNDKKCLAPAAFHCPNPSNYQAFHFGLHKTIKVTQYDRNELRYFGSIVHWDNILEIIKHYKKTRSVALAYALIGFYESIVKQLASEHINFDNEKTLNLFSKWVLLPNSIILSKANRISYFFSLLPDNLALQIILFHRNLLVADWKTGLQTFTKNIIKNKLSLYRKGSEYLY